VSVLTAPVETSLDVPASTSVVVIGGGLVGLFAGLTLAERGIPVIVLEKGRVGGEQSSRNLGWIRKMGRAKNDVPLSLASDRLWADMPQRVGSDVGYRQSGIMYIVRTQAEMAKHSDWLESVKELSLDSRLLSATDIDKLVPGGVADWAGGIYTPSDGRAEPALAASWVAWAAQARGAVVVENCAARTLSMSAGRVSGVVTERGEIRCEHVLLAGGLWSRRFLGNLGIPLLALPILASVARTGPLDAGEITVGAPDFSFRKRQDGGYTIGHRGAMHAPMTLDNLLIGSRYLSTLRNEWTNVRVTLGRQFLSDLALPRRWSGEQCSPFERVRTMDPPANVGINTEAMDNIIKAWPLFRNAVIKQHWAGLIDVTPDSLPVIGPIEQIPGLTVATGFSGHGFATAPGAGQLAADLVTGAAPLVDPTPYLITRF